MKSMAESNKIKSLQNTKLAIGFRQAALTDSFEITIVWFIEEKILVEDIK